MYIAATAVSMEAARCSRERKNQAIGLLPASTDNPQSGTGSDFGLRLATQINSVSASQTVACSMISPTPDPWAQCTTDNNETTTNDKGLSRLAQQVIGRPVSVQASLATPARGNAGQASGSGLPAQFAQLTSITSYHQEETQLFSAQGRVQTTDGREIAFDFGLALHRSATFTSTTSLGLTAALVDPLVLQFDLDAPLLADSSFLFDLDSNGDEDLLACPGRGCGFLAFDRNQDGSINNGSELFGPTSGSGFGELALLDSDANSWIDEGDPLFDQLLIWQPNGQGGQALMPLRQAGVGAISVVHAGTEFQLLRSTGEMLGRIKGSGIFLTEGGEVRSLQEIDLAMPSDQTATPVIPEQANAASKALLALRSIIRLQRLRLSLLLTGQRLTDRLPTRLEAAMTGTPSSVWQNNSQPWSFLAGLVDRGTTVPTATAMQPLEGDEMSDQGSKLEQAQADRRHRIKSAAPVGMAAMLERVAGIGAMG